MSKIIGAKSKVIGIIGARCRNSESDFEKTMVAFKKIYKKGDVICSGGCPKGGDRFAEIIAKKLGIPIIIYYPDWNGQGKSAGFIRNAYIAKASDILIACVVDDRKGGTEDTINKFKSLKTLDTSKVILI